MKIKRFRNIKSLLGGIINPVEVTIKIDLTFVKRFSEIIVAELDKLGIKIEVDDCIKIVTNMLNEYTAKKKEKS